MASGGVVNMRIGGYTELPQGTEQPTTRPTKQLLDPFMPIVGDPFPGRPPVAIRPPYNTPIKPVPTIGTNRGQIVAYGTAKTLKNNRRYS